MKKGYRLYQIQVTKESSFLHKRVFLSLDKKETAVDLARDNYKMVYEGVIESDSGEAEDILNELFYILNMEHPSGYRARSLSVSDIVEIDNEFYHCQNGGWKKVLIGSLDYVPKRVLF